MSEVIYSPDAPAPIGPYRQAIRAGGFLFVSGQLAIDPRTNTYTPAPVGEEARRVMENMGAVLKAAGLGYQHVVKCSIFLQSMKDFPAVNDIYASFFGEQCPARETIEVRGLPLGAKVEISCIAAQ